MRNGSVGRLWTLNTMETSRRRLLICMLMIDMADWIKTPADAFERIIEASEEIRVRDVGIQDNQRNLNLARYSSDNSMTFYQTKII